MLFIFYHKEKKMNIRPLLPVGSRVTHFDGGPDTHGTGTIVAHNRRSENTYAQENLAEAAEMAGQVGLLGGLVSSMYSGDRYPYAVQWDPNPKYPQYPKGYKDVYEPESIRLVQE